MSKYKTLPCTRKNPLANVFPRLANLRTLFGKSIPPCCPVSWVYLSSVIFEEAFSVFDNPRKVWPPTSWTASLSSARVRRKVIVVVSKVAASS